MINNIEIDKLYPHPDNPRTDLGDLTELSESIKATGILQNLTVVPGGPITDDEWKKLTEEYKENPNEETRNCINSRIDPSRYTVVIGHRRLAAAKLAGLTELPCAVVEMTQEQQVSTMLLENMQRSDLTLYEQAQGFQMLLDFGESVTEIAKKTGFSQTTVRRRVKLLELDQDKFKASVSRGATLMDYVALLEKIEDIELRNRVLEKIGTPDFNWELKRAIQEETTAKKMVLLKELLDTFAKRIDKVGENMRYVQMIYAFEYEKFKKPDDIGASKYWYLTSDYEHVSLYTEYKPFHEDQAEIARQQQERDKRRAIWEALQEESLRAYNLRWEFVNEYSNAKAKKHKSIITEYLMRSMLEGGDVCGYDELFQILDIEFPEDRGGEEWNYNDIAEKVVKEPERCLLAAVYLRIDSEYETYLNWNNKYSENEQLDMCYEMLERLGYEISEQEQQLRDGTHELFLAQEDGS